MFRNEIGDTRTSNGQEYRLIGFQPYTRANGSETELALWEGHCAQCGAPFLIRLALSFAKFQPNRRCAKHKSPGKRVSSIAVPARQSVFN